MCELARAFEEATIRIPANLREMMRYTFHEDEQRKALRECMCIAIGISPLFFCEPEGDMVPLSSYVFNEIENTRENEICEILHNPHTSCLEILGLTMVWIKMCQSFEKVSSIRLIRDSKLAWNRCARILEKFIGPDSNLCMSSQATNSIEQAQQDFERFFSHVTQT